MIDAATLAEVMEATWPPAARKPCGPFLLREGQGGGKRVSAATVEAAWNEADLGRAEATMAAPLFLIRDGDQTLDAALTPTLRNSLGVHGVGVYILAYLASKNVF